MADNKLTNDEVINSLKELYDIDAKNHVDEDMLSDENLRNKKFEDPKRNELNELPHMDDINAVNTSNQYFENTYVNDYKKGYGPYYQGRTNQITDPEQMNLPVEVAVRPLTETMFESDCRIMLYSMGMRIDHRGPAGQILKEFNDQFDKVQTAGYTARKPEGSDVFDSDKGGYSVICDHMGKPLFAIYFDRQLQKSSSYDRLQNMISHSDEVENEHEQSLSYFENSL